MPEAVVTMDGWYCLHDFRTLDWTAWKYASEEERGQAVSEFRELIGQWEETQRKIRKAAMPSTQSSVRKLIS